MYKLHLCKIALRLEDITIHQTSSNHHTWLKTTLSATVLRQLKSALLITGCCQGT